MLCGKREQMRLYFQVTLMLLLLQVPGLKECNLRQRVNREEELKNVSMVFESHAEFALRYTEGKREAETETDR